MNPNQVFDPCRKLDSDSGLLGFTFLRDSRADDLVYRVQVSNDLVSWTSLVESVGGAAASGSGLVSDSQVEAGSDFYLVTVVDTIAPSTSERRFVRLMVVRMP